MRKILILILTVLLLSACEKEQIEIGLEIMPIDSINPNAPLWAESYLLL